uniref:V-type proton ATPase subunit n=1 Tax=Spongospora subterranea TaxID=70186 RepID=A0A0H5R052_9EUKA|eukprot:CRZ01199.1 hypothetical protein [Spongospora subterranea]
MTDDRLDFYEEESYIRSTSSPGSLLTFNINYGFLEAQFRGFRSGFLSDLHYRQLCQCETLDDVKLTLSDTDYASSLQALQVPKLTPELVVDTCSAKLHKEYDYIRSQATGAMATFMDLVVFEFMIDNISFLILSLIKGGAPDELLAKCNPMGRFPRIKSILTFENTEEGFLDLYSTVLVDTPVACYFEKYFEIIAPVSSDSFPFEHMHKTFSEEDIDVINDVLKRLWLEDFYAYCSKLGGETWTVMKPLLEFEVDRRAICIMINSFSTPLNDPVRRAERTKLFATFGTLYPSGIDKFAQVGDMSQLGGVLEDYKLFSQLWQKAHNEGKEIEDVLYEREVELNREAFQGQSHFAFIWAYIKLKEQERRNLFWISECINQQQKDPSIINRWISPF